MKKWMILAAAILVVLGIGFAVKGASDRKPTVQPSETALPEATAEPPPDASEAAPDPSETAEPTDAPEPEPTVAGMPENTAEPTPASGNQWDVPEDDEDSDESLTLDRMNTREGDQENGGQ